MTDDPDDYFTEAGQARADASYQRLQKRQARLLVLTRQATDRNATEDEYQVADRSQPAETARSLINRENPASSLRRGETIVIVPQPSGFIPPCLPTRVERPPSGPLWVHEIKHDGYRLMVRRDGQRIHCYTKNGHDWADRLPAIVEAARRLKTASCLIDGEAVILNDDGSSDFNALRSKRSAEAVLVAFDMLELHGEDLRGLSLHERKRRLKTLLGRGGKWRAIQYGDHLTGAGPTIFAHVCQMGLEGIVSKRLDSPYCSGPSRTWLKSKNPASEAVRREHEEEWR